MGEKWRRRRRGGGNGFWPPLGLLVRDIARFAAIAIAARCFVANDNRLREDVVNVVNVVNVGVVNSC